MLFVNNFICMGRFFFVDLSCDSVSFATFANFFVTIKKIEGKLEYTSRHCCVVVLSCYRYIKGTKLIWLFLIFRQVFLFYFLYDFIRNIEISLLSLFHTIKKPKR